MIRRGSPVSRGLVVACLGGILLLLIAAVILPLREWRREILAAEASATAESERLKTGIARLQSEAGQLSDDGIKDIIWTAKRLGEATAQIQSRINELAQVNELAVRSIAPSGERALPLSRAVTFHLEMEAALDKLAKFLVEMEYHKPALVVDRATLRRLARPGPSTEQPVLFVQLDFLAPVSLASKNAK